MQAFAACLEGVWAAGGKLAGRGGGGLGSVGGREQGEGRVLPGLVGRIVGGGGAAEITWSELRELREHSSGIVASGWVVPALGLCCECM